MKKRVVIYGMFITKIIVDIDVLKMYHLFDEKHED